MGRLKLKGKKKRERMRITELKMADGTTVTDPDEVVRLLRLNGFTVDDVTGAIGVEPGHGRPQ